MTASAGPAAVPDDATGADVRPGVDTDGDGLPDTLLTADGVDLLVHTDLDGDGLVDRVLRIGPDGIGPRDPPTARRGRPDGRSGPGWLGRPTGRRP